MSITRQEYLSYLKANPKTSTPQYDSSILRSASISSEHLTGSREWDAYLERIQPLLDEAKESAMEWLRRLGGAMTEQDIRVAQFNYQACQARVATLEEVLAIPKEIMRAAQQSLSHDVAPDMRVSA